MQYDQYNVVAYTPQPSPYHPAAVVVGDGPVPIQSVDPSTIGKPEPGHDVFAEHPHQEIKSDGAIQPEQPAQGQPQAPPPPPEQLIADEKVDKDISAVGQSLTDAATSSELPSSAEESSTASSEAESSTSSQVEESKPDVPLGVPLEDEAEADKVRQELFPEDH